MFLRRIVPAEVLTCISAAGRFASMEFYQPLIGLLGGIGAGKSTAAACFSRLGCGLIDADRIAHQILQKPEVIQKITDLFGTEVLSETGLADRKKLASAAFSSQAALDALTGIIHPLVLARCEEIIRQFRQDPSVRGIVLDMPLLVEVGWDKHCDALVFMDCSQALRNRRIGKKREMDSDQQKKRENFQISLDKKKKMANFIIDNNSDESELAKQVEKVFSAIRDRR
jgi:dephospho-CoA kinase